MALGKHLLVEKSNRDEIIECVKKHENIEGYIEFNKKILMEDSFDIEEENPKKISYRHKYAYTTLRAIEKTTDRKILN